VCTAVTTLDGIAFYGVAAVFLCVVDTWQAIRDRDGVL